MLFRFRQAFRDISIRRKLILMVTSTSGLALAMACGGFVLQDVLTFRATTRDHTATLAAIVGNNTVAALMFNDSGAAKEVLAALAGEPAVIAAILYKDNQPFARYARRDANLPDPVLIPTGAFASFADGRLELARPVMADDAQLGTIYLVTDLSVLDQRLHRYIVLALGLLVAAMVAAYLLSRRFQRIISRPVSELVQLMQRVSVAKDYRMRAYRHSHDELGALSDGFNEMLTQIQQRDSALQSAHEDLERRVVERTGQLQQQVAERVAAERALQQQLTRISLLNQITNALADRQDLDSIVGVVLAQLEAHLPVDFGSVSIFGVESANPVIMGLVRRVERQTMNS